MLGTRSLSDCAAKPSQEIQQDPVDEQMEPLNTGTFQISSDLFVQDRQQGAGMPFGMPGRMQHTTDFGTMQ